jgi:hypothetical protein
MLTTEAYPLCLLSIVREFGMLAYMPALKVVLLNGSMVSGRLHD